MIASDSVKICSLREVEHGRFVLDAGADLFGLIFAPARRQVTIERAREIVDAVRTGARDRPPLAVGVFVDAPAAEINAVVRATGIDLAQLHGAESPEFLGELDVPAIKVFRPGPGATGSDLQRKFERYASAERTPVAYLIDGFHPSHPGGEGIQADWKLAAELAKSWPIMLAGGLTPENIDEAISAVRPVGVDVASGVETDGVKDSFKIKKFVWNARAAFGTFETSMLDR